MLSLFFKSILPDTGKLVLAYKNKHAVGGLQHKIFENQASMVSFLSQRMAAETDYWFALAGFVQGWHYLSSAPFDKAAPARPRLRTQANAGWLKCLFLDIDVGENKHYKTREEAIAALKQFKELLGLPSPWVVASGAAGLHIYFPFSESIEAARWTELAHRFKAAVAHYGLHADPTRTADSASILRPPSSWNYKTTPPAPVSILYRGQEADASFYEEKFANFETHTAPAATVTTESIAPVAAPAFITRLFSKVAAVFNQLCHPSRLLTPPDPLIVLKGCGQMREQNGAQEPVWRGMLATMRVCQHGEYVAHRISQIDPRYKYEDTQRKLDALSEKSIAPYTCETLSQLRPEVCAKCPLKGKVKTPAAITKEMLENESAKETITQTDTGNAQAPAIKIPTITTNKTKVSEEGLFVKDGNGDNTFWRQLTSYPVYPIQKIRGVTSKGETAISYIFRKHNRVGYDDIEIAGSTLLGNNLTAALGDYGFLLVGNKEKQLMSQALPDLLRALDEAVPEVSAVNRLGWDDAQQNFVLGNKLYRPDGSAISMNRLGAATQFSNWTKPCGSLETWKKIANVYNKEGMEWAQVVVATAFASPLMPIGALERAALLFITGTKGAGKSTALMTATSVYGNPTMLTFNKSDTINSRFHKLGILSNITAAFDEMTDMSPKEASEFAYTLTQGRGKDRMSQTGETLQLNNTYWSCLPVMSANDSIISALAQHSSDPTAQMSRVLEVKATDINKIYSADELRDNELLARMLPHNYGTAGAEYISWVVQNRDTVLKLICTIEEAFRTASGLNSAHRFWSYMCVRLLAGVHIAKHLGLVDYDTSALFKYLVEIVKKAKIGIAQYEWNPDSTIAQLLHSLTPNRLIVAQEDRGSEFVDNPETNAANDLGYVLAPPSYGAELKMRISMKEGICTLRADTIKDWAAKMGVPIQEIVDALRSQYKMLLTANGKLLQRGRMGAGTIFRVLPSVDCYRFYLPPADLEEMREEAAQVSETAILGMDVPSVAAHGGSVDTAEVPRKRRGRPPKGLQF